MKKRSIIAGSAVALVAAAVMGALNVRKSHQGRRVASLNASQAAVRLEREKADELYAGRPDAARSQYEKIIRENRSSSDPKVQDVVAASRMRLGYIAANQKHFAEARKQFMMTARTYVGTGVRSPDFGGYSDQAEYQAAVCLMAEGKDKDAARALLTFMADHWDSPLIHGAYQRLQRLGADNQEAQDLLQLDISKQEKKARFEDAVCGPKVISQLLCYLKRPAVPYSRVAKLCGTSEHGTSVEGMRKGMRALGLMSYAFIVNRKDFANLPSPCIWLRQDHYLILLSASGNGATVYDPLWAGEREMRLPPSDDTTFQAPVITLNVPSFLETKSL